MIFHIVAALLIGHDVFKVTAYRIWLTQFLRSWFKNNSSTVELLSLKEMRKGGELGAEYIYE
jgi:hypothetical protein